MRRLGSWLRRVRTWLLSGPPGVERRLTKDEQLELQRDTWFRPR